MVAKFNTVPKSAWRYIKYLLDEAVQLDPNCTVCAYGTAARQLGIRGRELTQKEVEHLVTGLSVDGKTKLGRSHRYRQWGFELLFSAPSRVSTAAQVLDKPRVRTLSLCGQKATHDAMAFIERGAAFTRVTEHGVKKREPIGLIYFVFSHTRNRAGEAFVHNHVVVLSRGRRANGQWAAIENIHVLRAQKAAYRVFNQALAHHIEKDLGLHVVRTKKAIAIKGVDAEWAKTERREQVKAEQKRTGRRDRKGATSATLKTRKPKIKASFDELHARWRKKAHDAGRYAVDLFTRAARACADWVQERRADGCYRFGAKYVGENVTTFSAQKVDETAALFATARNIAPDWLTKASQKFRAEPHKYGVVRTGEEQGHVLYSSARRQSRESKLYGELARLGTKSRGQLGERQIARALAGSERVNGSEDLLKVQKLVAAKGVVANEGTSSRDPALALAVTAYGRNKVPVVAIASTPDAAGRLRDRLDVKTYTSAEFAEKRRPPGHAHCVSTSLLFGRGNPHQRMGQAEQMRRKRLKLPEKCVVVAEVRREEVMELRSIVKAVKEARGKLILTGPESYEINARIQSRVRGEQYTPEFRPGQQPNEQTRAQSQAGRGARRLAR